MNSPIQMTLGDSILNLPTTFSFLVLYSSWFLSGLPSQINVESLFRSLIVFEVFYLIQSYHNPFNLTEDFLVQNMVVICHIMFHTLIFYLLSIQKNLIKTVYPSKLQFA